LDLFHTSPAHVARFDALRDRLAPGLSLHHHVHEDWLSRACKGGVTAALSAEVSHAIKAAGGRKLCTCTTLGPIAEAAGAVRIDRPLMQAAARIGGRICLAYCLESTANISKQLLEDCIAEHGAPAKITPLCLGGLWPLFETGKLDAFADAIAAAIRGHMAAQPGTTCVVLAQASMEGAASFLTDTKVPVLAAPELAFRAALARPV
jgi:hypothetical protein